ncbi:hypothetical protein HDU92_000268 [Lobulomyces angularis]|nr:hypothetical protein HDU92_000268 [Lobulomyces angularis]
MRVIGRVLLTLVTINSLSGSFLNKVASLFPRSNPLPEVVDFHPGLSRRDIGCVDGFDVRDCPLIQSQCQDMICEEGIITVSDRCYNGTAEDLSSVALKEILQDQKKFDIKKKELVPDEVMKIQKVICSWTRNSDENIDLILLTGGTGFGTRDVTPEAVTPILDKVADGLSVAMLTNSLKITPFAALSRPVCGIRNKSIIITLPGSPKAAKENLESILNILPHALELTLGLKDAGEKFHKDLKNDDKFHHYNLKPLQRGIHNCGHHHDNDKSNETNKSDLLGLPVALRSRKSPFEMISFEKALNLIKRNYPKPKKISKKVDFDLVGYVICEDIFSQENLPDYRASIVDGYAIYHNDGKGEFAVIDSATAGEDSVLKLSSKEICRITTGALVPEGATAVVMVEDTEVIKAADDGKTEDIVGINVEVSEGENIREIGSDVLKGELLLEKGTLITQIGAEIGMLACCGISEVNVYKKPIVAVLSTGNEVVDHFQKLGKGQVRDANRPSLISAIKCAGFEYLDLGIASDDPAKLEEIIRFGLSKCDVLITTGGVSMGEKDFLKSILEQNLKGEILFGRVSLKPGKPTTFVKIPKEKNIFDQDKICFSLPGNPVSALVTFFLFVLPTLKWISGEESFELPKIRVMITESIQLDPRPEFQRARAISIKSPQALEYFKFNKNIKAEEEGIGFIVNVNGFQRSSRLKSCLNTNVLICLPGFVKGKLEVLQPGTCLDAIVIENIGF